MRQMEPRNEDICSQGCPEVQISWLVLRRGLWYPQERASFLLSNSISHWLVCFFKGPYLGVLRDLFWLFAQGSPLMWLEGLCVGDRDGIRVRRTFCKISRPHSFCVPSSSPFSLPPSILSSSLPLFLPPSFPPTLTPRTKSKPSACRLFWVC